MAVSNTKRLVKVLKDYQEQQKWIEDHGSTLQGYINRYGSKNDKEYYGSGGEAIYAADKAELDRLNQMGMELLNKITKANNFMQKIQEVSNGIKA